MAKKGATTYTLEVKGGISSSTIRRLKAGESVSTNTLDALCNILSCDLHDIIEHIPENKTNKEDWQTHFVKDCQNKNARCTADVQWAFSCLHKPYRRTRSQDTVGTAAAEGVAHIDNGVCM